LVQVCNNPNHKIFSLDQVKALESLNLISGGRVNLSVQNVVKSAVEGEGFEMTIGSPITQTSN
jgi:hypothetical protein